MVHKGFTNDLHNDSRLNILEREGELSKSSDFVISWPSAQSSSQNKTILNTNKNLKHLKNKTAKVNKKTRLLTLIVQ